MLGAMREPARSRPPNQPLDRSLPPWADCEIFCVHSYAGEDGPPCGWRGRLAEVREPVAGGGRVCPWCGATSLLRIPPAAPGSAGA